MNVDKTSFCFQGEIRSVSGPMDNGTKVEIQIDLGTKANSNAGEFTFRVPVIDGWRFRIGKRYAVSATPVGE